MLQSDTQSAITAQTEVSVAEAENIILSHAKNYGTEKALFTTGSGRVLAENICADSALPPFNRATMDGIAIQHKAFKKGTRYFKIRGMQAAGNAPLAITNLDECIEIMTGAALPESTDTIIRYEDVRIKNGVAEVMVESIRKGQNLHLKGSDKKEGDVVAEAGQIITPALINIAASVGATKLEIKKLPSVLIISTGDELVEADEVPGLFQIRSSNKHTIAAALQLYGINADVLHLPDAKEIIRSELLLHLKQYNVLIISGGVSKGKFDFIPEALQEAGVQKLFYKVQQKPGKPFWFGAYQNKVLVFAFPGNPVSSFLCLYRYFIPWLEKSVGLTKKPMQAILTDKVIFKPSLQFFLSVKLRQNNGRIFATPVSGNGSGDYTTLAAADAFMELTASQDVFKKGDVFPVWLFKNIF